MNPFKSLFLCFFIVVFSESIAWTQCPPGNVSLESQAEVNNFAVLYPNCTKIDSTLKIGVDFPLGPTDIHDLSPLNQITSIEESLVIRNNSDLTNLGLINLTSIKSYLSISNNDGLIDLSGLENLTSVVEGVFVGSNDNLLNLSGLEGLTEIVKDLRISNNNSLNSLTGLENLTSIGRNFNLVSCNSLIDLADLINLTSIGYELNVRNNGNLISLKGLGNVTSIGCVLKIFNNDNLLNLNLENVTLFGESDYFCYYGTYISIDHNERLKTLAGLDNLTSTDILSITDNPSLDNLTGLGSMASPDFLYVHDNSDLTSLAGLENLTSVKFLSIINNDNLGSLTALGNQASFQNLNIINNPMLGACHASSICNYLKSDGISTIDNNALGCNNPEEILTLCTAADLTISPNPNNGMFSLQGIPTGTYRILNTSGQIIREGSMQNDLLIDISREAQGVYFISITIDNVTLVRRVIKM